jgi:hypothetical protein
MIPIPDFLDRSIPFFDSFSQRLVHNDSRCVIQCISLDVPVFVVWSESASHVQHSSQRQPQARLQAPASPKFLQIYTGMAFLSTSSIQSYLDSFSPLCQSAQRLLYSQAIEVALRSMQYSKSLTGAQHYFDLYFLLKYLGINPGVKSLTSHYTRNAMSNCANVLGPHRD